MIYATSLRLTLVIGVWVGLLSDLTYGAVLVSNFSEPLRDASGIGNNPNPTIPDGGGPWAWAAQSFVNDGALNALTTVELMVGDGSVDPAPVVVAQIRSDDNGAIGEQIATLASPTMDGPLSTRLFTPDVGVILQPGATYWVVVGSEAPGDGTFYFAYADSNQYEGTGAISTWADSSDSGADWNYGTDFPYFLQVSVIPADADADGDGVLDIDDACCGTPPGAEVDATGRPIGDLDLDCDTDLLDYDLFSRGFTGPLSSECP
jgi:hypothetical protein